MRTEHDVPLCGLTTMRVGGPAARLVTAENADDVVNAVREVDDAGEPLLVVAGGSNLVVADAGFAGTVVHVDTRELEVEASDRPGAVAVRVAAGENWDDLVAHAVEQGWSGIEALSGIPGSVGATPVQNVGAYGQEVAQTIVQVRVWDRDAQQVRTFSNADCAFRYRHSVFKDTIAGGTPRHLVLDVVFQLEQAELSQPIGYGDLARGLGVETGQRVPLAAAREAVLEQRRRRGMVLDPDDHDTWSCGSFFTNPIIEPEQYDALAARAVERLGAEVGVPPRFDVSGGKVKTSAAWLIDRAGFGKGHRLPGPAALSTKHTLALTNRGTASSEDVIALAREVRDGVQDAFGVTLVNEPVLVGLTL